MAARCTLELHLDGRWHTAGELRVFDESRGIESPSAFDYDIDFLDRFESKLGARGVHAVSCRYPLGYQAYHDESWPAFLLDVIPSGAARRTWERELGLPNTARSDWALLLRGGDNPPGNVRIQEAARSTLTLPDHPGFSREELLERSTDFLDYARMHGASIAGGSGAGGDAPKFLLREDHEGRFHADGALSDARTARAWLVKFPRSSHQDDRIVLRAERCYHRVATRMGVRTHGELEWQRDTLFIPRFDRVIGAVDGTSTVVRLGLESLCSLAGVAEFGAPIPKERLLTSLVAHATDPISEIRELVLRDLLDRALGNTDNHARNTAVLKHTDGHIALSPLYDFAPMFLDTQGIARVCRWDSERAGALDYGAWLETLAQAGLPNAKATLSTFAHRFAELRAIVREEDVPARVAQRCAPWIDRVTRELEALS